MTYYGRKLACEREVETAAVPSTTLRITQFHELIAFVLGKLERLPLAPLAVDWRIQSIAAADAAARLVEVAERPPEGRAHDVGGPEFLTLGEIAAQWRAVRGRPRRVVGVPLPGRVAAGFRAGHNTGGDASGQPWGDFVAALPT